MHKPSSLALEILHDAFRTACLREQDALFTLISEPYRYEHAAALCELLFNATVAENETPDEGFAIILRG